MMYHCDESSVVCRPCSKAFLKVQNCSRRHEKYMCMKCHNFLVGMNHDNCPDYCLVSIKCKGLNYSPLWTLGILWQYSCSKSSISFSLPPLPFQIISYPTIYDIQSALLTLMHQITHKTCFVIHNVTV